MSKSTGNNPAPGLKFRRAREKDLSTILDIENRSFSDPWPREAFDDIFESGQEFWVVEKNRKIAGFVNFIKAADEVQIYNIAVLDEFRNQGLGTRLMNFALSYFKDTQSAILEVRPSNREAVNLYLKIGFKIINKRKKYYDNGEDAFTMIKTLEKA